MIVYIFLGSYYYVYIAAVYTSNIEQEFEYFKSILNIFAACDVFMCTKIPNSVSGSKLDTIKVHLISPNINFNTLSAPYYEMHKTLNFFAYDFSI